MRFQFSQPYKKKIYYHKKAHQKYITMHRINYFLLLAVILIFSLSASRHTLSGIMPIL